MIDPKDAIEVADAVWRVTGDKNVAKVWDQIKDLLFAQPEITECPMCPDCPDNCPLEVEHD